MAIKKIYKINYLNKLKDIDFLLVALSTAVSSIFSFIFSVLAKRYVSPLEYGIYSTCLLLQTYITYFQFGVLNAYNRDYPQIMGSGDFKKAALLKSTVFSFYNLVYIFVIVLISIFLVFLFANHKLTKEYFWGYLVSLILLISNTLSDFAINTLRMNGEYIYTAFATVFRTCLSVVIGIISVRRFGYYGLYVMPAMAGLTSICLFYKKSVKNIRFFIDKSLLKECIWTGLPLMINSLVWTAVASVDKFVILGFMNTEALGIYSIAQLGFSVMILIPQSMSQVFYIKISAVYGRTRNKTELINMCNEYTFTNTLFTSIVCVLGYYILPIFVQLIMPKYIDGIFAAQIMFVGIAIYGSTMLYGNIFSVLRLNKDLLWTSIILCVFNIVFSITLVFINGRNINNVALGTAVSYAAFSFLLMFRLSKRFSVNICSLIKKSWIPLITIILPGILMYHTLTNIYIGFMISLLYIVAILVLWILKIKRK